MQALDKAEANHILVHFKDGAVSHKFKGLHVFVPDSNEVRGGVGEGVARRGREQVLFGCVTHIAVHML